MNTNELNTKIIYIALAIGLLLAGIIGIMSGLVWAFQAANITLATRCIAAPLTTGLGGAIMGTGIAIGINKLGWAE